MGDRTSLGPLWHSLFHGAVRESLAAINCVARLGTQDTHAWEQPLRYVVDDNQGNAGLIEFRATGAIAAVSARAPVLPFDCALAVRSAPPDLQADLAKLCEAPLLKEGLGLSAVFWTDGESLAGPDKWQNVWRNGADLFHRELLPDSAWEEEGIVYYGLSPEVARLAMAASSRAAVRVPLLTLADRELHLLIPNDSTHDGEARDLLFSDGLFNVLSSATS